MHPFHVDLEGKTALVCGAGAGGAGTATSLLLAQCGATIVAVDHSQALVDEIKEQVEKLGARCVSIVADLQNDEMVKTVVPAALKATGRIDFVANIAGGTQPGQWKPIEALEDHDFKSIMMLNYGYVFRICRDVGRHMISQGHGGAFVNISSMSAHAAAPYHAAYGAAKRAVVAFTQSMAVEWGQHNIRANVVSPGAIRTARALAMGADLDGRAKEWTPLQRPVEKEEIANAVVFLLSDLARAITGQNLTVDCGNTARSPGGDADYYKQYVR